MTKDKKTKTLLLYLLMFSIFAGIIVFFFYSKNRTFVCKGDGFRQHYKAILYYSDYLKQVVHGIVVDHRFTVPQFDFSIGEGSDILKTLHYYCIGDPITLLSVFFNHSNMYLFYDFSILLRMMLAGLAFISLCYTFKKSDTIAIASGAMVYTFCIYSTASMVSHPFFLNPLLYLPLVVGGIEKVLNDDKPYRLIISVALASLSSIYFFYIIVLLSIIYTTVRLLLTGNDIKSKIRHLFMVGGFAFIGVMLSSFVFVPMIDTLLSNNRVSMSSNINLLKDADFYLKIFPSFILGGNSGNIYLGGFTIIGVFAIISMFIERRNKTLIVLFLLMMFFECVPFFSYLFNGMAYESERWLFGLSLLVSYIIVDCFDLLLDLDKHKWMYVAFTLIFYAVCIYSDAINIKVYALYSIVSFGLITFVCLIKNRSTRKCLCLFGTLFFIGFYILFQYSPILWNVPDTMLSREELNDVFKGEVEMIESIDDDIYRYSGDAISVNTSMLTDASSANFYWSISNDSIADYRRDMGFSDNSSYHYKGEDHRYDIMMLDGVKYYLTTENDAYIPYGYEYRFTGYGFDVYENEDALPLIYAYDNYIVYSDWIHLSLIERQEAMTQAIVLEKDARIQKKSLKYNSIEVPYVISQGNNLELENNRMIAHKNDATITLGVDSNLPGEYYILINDLNTIDVAKTYIDIIVGSISKYVEFKSVDYPSYSQRHNFAVNLGYLPEGLNDDIVLNFRSAASYDCSGIRVVCLPMDQEKEHIHNLDCTNLSNLAIDGNTIVADIDINENKILCISIPYGKGWKAFVDGNATDVFKGNVGYLAIYADSGKHHLELSYSTPWSKEGLLISFGGLVILLGYTIYDKKKNSVLR